MTLYVGNRRRGYPLLTLLPAYCTTLSLSVSLHLWLLLSFPLLLSSPSTCCCWITAVSEDVEATTAPPANMSVIFAHCSFNLLSRNFSAPNFFLCGCSMLPLLTQHFETSRREAQRGGGGAFVLYPDWFSPVKMDQWALNCALRKNVN